jgi:type VI secretion system protein ImpF
LKRRLSALSGPPAAGEIRADISLRERLQPALLDRLYDDERVVHLVELIVPHARLTGTTITVSTLANIMRSHGLRRVEGSVGSEDIAAPELRLQFTTAAGELPLARLKALTLPTGAGGSVLLGDLGRFEVRTSVNQAQETSERRFVSMRRLRESVFRDLTWLLNTTNLETTEDLARYPEVQRSVLNFGLASLTGRVATSVDPALAAQRIAQGIRTFEPRLTRVTVTPELSAERMDMRTLSFKVDAELWGRPVPQHLVLRTRLDIDSGDLSVSEAAGA